MVSISTIHFDNAGKTSIIRMLPRAHLTELSRAGGETIGILCEIGILENDAARQTSHSGAHSAYLFSDKLPSNRRRFQKWAEIAAWSI